MELNIRQQNLVKANEEKILCVAQAACGKTATLTERVRYLLNSGVAPEKIVAISFTNMAAGEMKRRLGAAADGMFIGTFHGYANYICIKNGINTTPIILAQKFDKLLEKATSLPLFKFPKVDYLLVDEFQDTSEKEYKFMMRISAKNLFCVGDARQAIYGFNGASDKFFEEMYRDISVTKYYLTESYRCPPNILEYADSKISSLRKIGPSAQPVKTKDGQIFECGFEMAVDEIERLKNYVDWFIICRTNNEVERAMEILNERGIPNLTFKKADLDLAGMEARLRLNKVKILTIHQMKGLEGKHIVVVGARMYNDEERRISYVAATRAEEELYWCPSIAPRNKKKKSSGAAAKKQIMSFI